MSNIIHGKQNNSREVQPTDGQDFLTGESALSALISSKDWAETAIGPIENWSQTLKTAVSMILQSPVPLVILWGPDGVMIYNDAYSEFAGERHPFLLGSTVAAGWSEVADFNRNVMNRCLRGEKLSYKDQRLILYRNNVPEEVAMDLNYSPIIDEKGQPAGVLAIVVETTQRLAGERQLESLRELSVQTAQARTVKDACNRMINALKMNAIDMPFALLYLVDEKKQVLSLAGAAGVDEEHELAPEIIKMKSNDLWPVARVVEDKKICLVTDLANGIQELPKGHRKRSPEQAAAIPVIQTGTSDIAGILVVGLSPYRMYDDHYERFLYLIAGQIASGIANAQAYEQEIIRSESLVELDKYKTQFFSNISHEFRTPLTLMLSPVQDMLEGQLTDVSRQHLEMVQRNGRRLQKLVNTLLDFSRIEAGRISANYQATDLASLTIELASNFKAAIEKGGMILRTEISPLSDDIFVDRDMWEKIVLNLLSNAFKFTFEGEIGITLTEHQQHVKLSVRDTGEGIASKDLLNIFERFKRVEGARARSHEGSGIGLSLVQELVKLHGGTIEVESVPRKGSEFIITIPKGKEHLPQDQVQKNPQLDPTTIAVKSYVEEAEQWLHFDTGPEASGLISGASSEFTEKPRIVLADDNADMRSYIHRLLSERFDITVTANGREALMEIQKELPQLVLTDVMMPEINGYELVKELKSNARTAQIPIVILSAKAGDEATVKGIEAGADDYLVKPFKSHELVARVSSLIASYKARYETENRLYEIFKQAPAVIAVLRGPDHVFEVANNMYMQLVGKDREILGKPLKEALPEVQEQGFIELLDNVYLTGEAFVGKETLVELDRQGSGQLEQVYFNFVYSPHRDLQGNTLGVFVHGVDVTELVKSREKIAENEERYRSLFETMDQGFAVVKMIFDENKKPLDYEFLEVNPVFERQTGLIAPIGKTVRSLVPGLETRWFDIYGNIALTGESARFVEGSDAMRRWFDVYAFRIGKAEDHKVAILLTDITERKQAEEALKRSEEYYKTMTDNTPVITWVTQPDGSCTYLNKQWYKITGQEPEKGLGNGWLDMVHPDDVEKSRSIFLKANEQQVPFSFEYRIKENYGDYRWYIGSGLPKFDDDGRYEGFVGAVIDIHERKTAEERLRDSEEFSRTLLESSPDCVIALNMDGKIISVNSQGLKMLQMDDFSEFEGGDWLDLWEGQYYIAAMSAVENARDGLIGHFQGFAPTLKSKPKWWDVLVAPIYGANGKVERLISVSRDITTLKELEQQKDDFIGIASHELKTPVTSIKAYTQVLQSRFSKAEDNQSAEMLAKMDNQLNKLTGLISDLLDVTKIEQGKLQFRNERFDFNELVGDTIEEVQRTATKHHIQRYLSGERSVIGDRERIGQVVTNFLTNAIKYSPGADKLIVRTSINDGNELVLSVQDFGLGLSQEDQKKVFDRFYRVGGSGHETYPGLGLGLYISSEIIKRHNGRIWVNSEKGSGSTFNFSLPLDENDKTTAAENS